MSLATKLKELALLFFKLGTIAFGGPAAHIAMIEDEVVRRRRWLTREEFLDLLAATNLIPGPNSTELAIHIGHRRAGWPGLIVAGACFILPAFAIVLAISWSYVAFGKLPQAAGILYGVKPVVIAIVAQALWKLGTAAIKTSLLAFVGVAVALANFLGTNELLLLLLAGVVVCLARFGKHWLTRKASMPAFFLGLGPALKGTAAATGLAFGLGPLFLFFLKTGAVLFGSGYVLLAFLRADLVEHWHWLTESQLLDAVAAGQITPGPVFTTATFVGYILGGFKGGVVATIGIFIPAFVFVALSGPLVPRMRRSPVIGAFLDGVVVASLGLMVVVTFALLRNAVVDWLTLLLAAVSLFLLIRCKINSAWLVLGGACAGSASVLIGSA
ncbi:MAG: chromate transporter [Chthoniobacterales bacterium]|nr:MAG: chromate transporter [Chthoniobacterales bacterium]